MKSLRFERTWCENISWACLVMTVVVLVNGCASSGRVVKDEGDRGFISVNYMFNSYPIAESVARNFCGARGYGFNPIPLINPGSIDPKRLPTSSMGFDVDEGSIYRFFCAPKPEVRVAPTPVEQQVRNIERPSSEVIDTEIPKQNNQKDEDKKIPSEIKFDRKLEDAKKKCTDLGFKPATEKFGQCVLRLSK